MIARRGACPALADPMPTGDGLLARLAVTRAPSLDEFAALCATARTHGNGIIEITSRGSIQVRGLTARSAPQFAEAVEALDIADALQGRVISNPLAGLDPNEVTDVSALADQVRAALRESGLATTLAPKVSAVIDGGGALHLDAIPADIRLRAEVTADGRCFQLVMAGDRTNARRVGTVTPECAVEAVTELLKTIAVEGSAARARDVCAPNLPRKGEVRSARLAAEPIGTHALRDASVALGLGLPFGHSDADTLQSLIEEARRAGAASVRPAPPRVLLVLGLAPAHAPRLAAAAQRLGFIIAPDDPRRRVVACAGAPACAAAEIPTRALAPAIAAAAAPLDRGATVHISGCAKGCAHPGPAALTIVGIDGKCGLVRNGRAQDRPRQLVEIADLPANVGRRAIQEADHG
jgi:precorrin-3B synthase